MERKKSQKKKLLSKEFLLSTEFIPLVLWKIPPHFFGIWKRKKSLTNFFRDTARKIISSNRISRNIVIHFLNISYSSSYFNKRLMITFFFGCILKIPSFYWIFFFFSKLWLIFLVSTKRCNCESNCDSFSWYLIKFSIIFLRRFSKSCDRKIPSFYWIFFFFKIMIYFLSHYL